MPSKHGSISHLDTTIIFIAVHRNVVCLLQFFSIALAHFSIHCLLFQNSSHTALNRILTKHYLMFAECHHLLKTHTPTHPSKPNISIKTYNLCSIENVCFLIYLTMDNKIQTTAININL